MLLICLLDNGITQEYLSTKLTKNGLNYTEFADLCGLSTGTIKNICNDSSYLPSGVSIKKIMTAAKNIDPNVNISTFWDI